MVVLKTRSFYKWVTKFQINYLGFEPELSGVWWGGEDTGLDKTGPKLVNC